MVSGNAGPISSTDNRRGESNRFTNDGNKSVCCFRDNGECPGVVVTPGLPEATWFNLSIFSDQEKYRSPLPVDRPGIQPPVKE
jgi:hypothetical protein